MKTPTAKHGTTPTTGCGCCVVPVDDRTEPADLCSEATGTFDGTGWRIKMCPTHARAYEMEALLVEAQRIVASMAPATDDTIRFVTRAEAVLVLP